MKGISTILAMILIVIIVVALIGLTYTFAVGLFTSTTTATTTTTNAVTSNMQKTIDIISVNCYNTTQTPYYVNFTLRNSGTVQIASQISVTLDGKDISSSSIVPATPAINVATDTLNPNQIRGYSYTGTPSAGGIITTRTLTVITPAGSVSDPLPNCPT